MACISEFEPYETMTVRRLEELIDDVEIRHAEEVSVQKETFSENADCLIIGMNTAKADSVQISVE